MQLKIVIVSIVSLLLTGIVFAELSEKKIDSIAGIVQVSDAKPACSLKLNDNVIINFDCEYNYAPTIIGDFKGNYAPFGEVIVVQELPMGNACNGGPIVFIGLKKDGSCKVSRKIDFCGGLDPIVTSSNDKVLAVFPGSQGNRGAENIPTEVWIFENGEVKQFK